jgi:hypothetical protein
MKLITLFEFDSIWFNLTYCGLSSSKICIYSCAYIHPLPTYEYLFINVIKDIFIMHVVGAGTRWAKVGDISGGIYTKHKFGVARHKNLWYDTDRKASISQILTYNTKFLFSACERTFNSLIRFQGRLQLIHFLWGESSYFLSHKTSSAVKATFPDKIWSLACLCIFAWQSQNIAICRVQRLEFTKYVSSVWFRGRNSQNITILSGSKAAIHWTFFICLVQRLVEFTKHCHLSGSKAGVHKTLPSCRVQRLEFTEHF